jgi:hypothetical protein
VVDTRLRKSKIASPPWVVSPVRSKTPTSNGIRRTHNDVEDVSVFCEGNAIWSRRVS